MLREKTNQRSVSASKFGLNKELDFKGQLAVGVLESRHGVSIKLCRLDQGAEDQAPLETANGCFLPSKGKATMSTVRIKSHLRRRRLISTAAASLRGKDREGCRRNIDRLLDGALLTRLVLHRSKLGNAGSTALSLRANASSPAGTLHKRCAGMRIQTSGHSTLSKQTEPTTPSLRKVEPSSHTQGTNQHPPW